MLRYLVVGFAIVLLAHGLFHWSAYGPIMVSGALLASAMAVAEETSFSYVRRTAREIAEARGLDLDLRARIERSLVTAPVRAGPVISPVAAEALRLAETASGPRGQTRRAVEPASTRKAWPSMDFRPDPNRHRA